MFTMNIEIKDLIKNTYVALITSTLMLIHIKKLKESQVQT